MHYFKFITYLLTLVSAVSASLRHGRLMGEDSGEESDSDENSCPDSISISGKVRVQISVGDILDAGSGGSFNLRLYNADTGAIYTQFVSGGFIRGQEKTVTFSGIFGSIVPSIMIQALGPDGLFIDGVTIAGIGLDLNSGCWLDNPIVSFGEPYQGYPVSCQWLVRTCHDPFVVPGCKRSGDSGSGGK